MAKKLITATRLDKYNKLVDLQRVATYAMALENARNGLLLQRQADDIQAELSAYEASNDAALASNVSTIEKELFIALHMIKENSRNVRLLQFGQDGLTAETHTVTLTNSLAYPFNSSVATISLDKLRIKTEYIATYDVLSMTGATGCSAGDIQIYDKLSNGFKVHFTGSAATVTIKLYVTGGF